MIRHPSSAFSLLSSICLLSSVLCLPSGASLQVSPAAATNISRTTAAFNGVLVSSNGAAASVQLRLCYGLSDGGTNLATWSNTNSLIICTATGAVTTNLTGLTPAQRYAFRWYALEGGTSAWSTVTNFWTLAGVPTNIPAALSYPVQVNASGDVVSPSNLWERSPFSVMDTNRIIRIEALTGGWETVRYWWGNNTSAWAATQASTGKWSAAWNWVEEHSNAFATVAQGAKADTALQATPYVINGTNGIIWANEGTHFWIPRANVVTYPSWRDVYYDNNWTLGGTVSAITNTLSANAGVSGSVITVGSGNYTAGVWTVTDGGGMSPTSATGTYHYVRSIDHGGGWIYYLRAKIPDDNWVISEAVEYSGYPSGNTAYIYLSYSTNYANPYLSAP